jgi:hypothetical protein
VKVPVKELQIERTLRLVHRKHANLSHAAMGFLEAVRSLAVNRGAPFQFEPEGASTSSRAVSIER